MNVVLRSFPRPPDELKPSPTALSPPGGWGCLGSNTVPSHWNSEGVAVLNPSHPRLNCTRPVI
jgi:hypothetical protein